MKAERVKRRKFWSQKVIDKPLSTALKVKKLPLFLPQKQKKKSKF